METRYTFLGIRPSKRKLFLVILGFCLISTITLLKTFRSLPSENKNELYCHLLHDMDTLPLLKDTKVKKDESIFFMETSCNSHSNGKIVINPRQACAVESAAIMNPGRTVYLLYASPGKFYDNGTESDRLVENLMSYSNIKILHFDIVTFIKGTPVENLWSTGRVQESIYQVSHTSDIVRLLILWKYGGIYLDLDVIVIKSLEDLPLNFAAIEDEDKVNGAVLSFTSDLVGHQYVSNCLKDISNNFDGSQWIKNGPELVTRMLFDLCNTHNVSEMTNRTCQGFHVLPASAFYPIHWSIWETLFDETQKDFVLETVKDSYLIHVWNKLSSETKISLENDVPYINLAKTYCPGTFESIDNYF